MNIDPIFVETSNSPKREIKNILNEEIDLHGYYCSHPFNHFEVSAEGLVWMCCPAYLPYAIGNVLEQDIEEIWNGKKAILLRKQILNGEFNYCQKQWCPAIQSKVLPKVTDFHDHELALGSVFPVQEIEYDVVNKGIWTDESLKMPAPTNIVFCNDFSCNLWCPSCRVEKIMHTSGPIYQKAKTINDKIVKAFLTEPTDRKFIINPLGSGDIFASKVIREMLYEIDGEKFPNMQLWVMTNGIMFTEKMWKRLHKIHNNLGLFNISFDAGTKETYEQKTRLGGNWDVLLKNCDFLNTKQDYFPQFKIAYHFVVQASNYKEMITFSNMVLNRFSNAQGINFKLVADWGTWSKQDYEQQAIWKTTHPEYEQFLEVLRDPIFDHPKMLLGNVSAYREKAINTYI